MSTYWDTEQPTLSSANVFVDLIERCIDRSEHLAVIDRGDPLTSTDLADRSLRLAAALRSHGVTADDRVAYLGPTSARWLECVLATGWLGAVPVTLNWRLAPGELSNVIEHARPAVLMVDESMVSNLAETQTSEVRVFSYGTYEAMLAEYEPDPTPAVRTPDDIAIQIYTSGTSGRPKGAMSSNAGLAAFLNGAARTFDAGKGCRGLYALPLFHIAGGGFALWSLAAGSTDIIIDSSAPHDMAAAIEHYGVTHMAMVPTLMQTMVDHAEQNNTDLSSIHRVIYGGAPVTPTLLSRTIETIGSVFLHTYGLTEASGHVTVLDPAEHDPTIEGRLNSCGRPVSWVDLRIADIETGERLEPGEPGEVQIKSVAVMKGYYKDPERTAESMTEDGYLRTGDIGMVDADGYVTIVDRLKDLIITGGENVAPSEVEEVLVTHPGIKQAVVFGIPDELWGESVAAAVVSADSEHLIEDDIIAFARERLAHYKCPRRVEMVDELPLGATGKIDRIALRSRYVR